LLTGIADAQLIVHAGKDAHGAHGRYLSRLLAQSKSGFFVDSGVTIAGGFLCD
jgi:hypothetical protein